MSDSLGAQRAADDDINQRPVPVRDDIVEGIRARLEGRAAPEPYFKPGECVRITELPFSQIEAIFLAQDGDERWCCC